MNREEEEEENGLWEVMYIVKRGKYAATVYAYKQLLFSLNNSSTTVNSVPGMNITMPPFCSTPPYKLLLCYCNDSPGLS